MSPQPMSFAQQHLQEAAAILDRLDVQALERMVEVLADIKAADGRLFFLGVGGSAANCSHAVNDFRKLAGIECYAPTDNVAELTARINDEGWESSFVGWLKVSRLRKGTESSCSRSGAATLKEISAPIW